MTLSVVTTRGGSRAILDDTVGEVMHPIVGPAVEAARIYVDPSQLAARLAVPAPKPLVLLDVGLGGGSNAIGAWHASEALSPETAARGARRLEIVSFDRDLHALALALEHAEDFRLTGAAGEAARAILSRGEHETERTHWRFVAGELPGTLETLAPASADVVFWDPYSPRSNPTMWTVAAFTMLRARCAPDARVYTYGGATATRAALLLGGFAVGFGVRIGDDGKKRATCAAFDARVLDEPLDARWLERLSRSSAAMPSDAPSDAFARIAAAPQFAGG